MWGETCKQSSSSKAPALLTISMMLMLMLKLKLVLMLAAISLLSLSPYLPSSSRLHSSLTHLPSLTDSLLLFSS